MSSPSFGSRLFVPYLMGYVFHTQPPQNSRREPPGTVNLLEGTRTSV